MILRLAVCTLLLALPFGVAIGAEDWPQFRGPTGQGISSAKGTPTQWGPEMNVAWKTPIPGRGWSSPVLVDGKLYVTSGVLAGDGAASLVALCMSADDGKILWQTDVFHPPANVAGQGHKKNSPSSATPIVAGDRLYVHFGPMGTAALDLSGKIIWKQEALKFLPVHGNGGSPALVDGLLIFSCDGADSPYLAALDAKTGDVKWKTPRNQRVKKTFSFSTPLAIEVGGATQVISPASGFVGAYDPKTGREIWRVRYGEGYSVVPRPVFADGLVFVSSGFDSPIALAIRPDGARGDVTNTHVAWSSTKGAPRTPSMLAVGDEIYILADNGVLTCADARTGKQHWSERLAGGFSASPMYADGKIYCQNETGIGYVVKAGKKFEKLAENALGEPSLASYAITDGALFIRTDKHLWKIK
jgi:outer membrane protein assembly factor BamB